MSHSEEQLELFEQTIVPHLNAAHNLARWLTRNQHDAEDLVQAAYLRAFHFSGASTAAMAGHGCSPSSAIHASPGFRERQATSNSMNRCTAVPARRPMSRTP
jgi:hypothetical protein